MGSIVMMYGAITGGSQDALAAIDVPQNGELIGIEWAAYFDLDLDQEEVELQVSFGSTRTQANDSRQVISNYATALNLTTSGASGMFGNHYTSLPNMPVGMGERIYLHSGASAGVTGEIYVSLHFSFDEARPSVRRR